MVVQQTLQLSSWQSMNKIADWRLARLRERAPILGKIQKWRGGPGSTWALLLQTVYIALYCVLIPVRSHTHPERLRGLRTDQPEAQSHTHRRPEVDSRRDPVAVPAS